MVETPICSICKLPITDDQDCIQVRSGGLEVGTKRWEFIASQDEGYYHTQCFKVEGE